MNASSGIGLRDFRWAAVLLAASWLLGLWLYARLPASVPVHWNIEGRVDRYGSPLEGALLPPAIATFLLLTLAFVPRLDPRRSNYASFRGAYLALTTGMIVFVIVIQGLLGAAALGLPLDVGRMIVPLVGLVFAGVGLLLPRLHPNWFAGIRTPWTLEDDRVWEATHRFAGKLFVVFGVLSALASSLLPWNPAFLVLIVGMLASTLGSVVYSYVVWRRLQAGATAPSK